MRAGLMLKGTALKPTLRKRLAVVMLGLSLSLISVLILLYYHTERALYGEFERQTSELVKAIKMGLEEVSTGGTPDARRLNEYLKKLDAKGVTEVSIVSNSDRIVSSTNPKDVGKWISKNKKELIFNADVGRPTKGEGQLYHVMVPIVSEGGTMGYIRLRLNAGDFSVYLRASAIRRIAAAGLIFLIGTALAVFLAGRYTKPIEEVVETARSVAAGNLSRELAVGRKDEIGDLAASFNYMVGKLREERGLREKLRRAEHLAGIGHFSQSIAHEIKNPLNFISLSVDHIREAYRPNDPERAAGFDSILANMKGEIQRVSRFAESFLEYGRPLELNRRETDINGLIGEVLDLASTKAKKDGIEIVRELGSAREGAGLLIDPEFMKTCLLNVVNNAFQAMPEGGRLTVNTSRSDGSFFITVGDTGVGVPPDKAGRVFDPFFTMKSGGLGLGLALTKRVVEEHGGKVSFKSEEGRGSTVSITLPAAGPEAGRRVTREA